MTEPDGDRGRHTQGTDGEIDKHATWIERQTDIERQADTQEEKTREIERQTDVESTTVKLSQGKRSGNR
jgi:hypothetical protein